MHDINTVLKYSYLLIFIIGKQLPRETYIIDAIVTKYASDICLGEQTSLGKCVRAHVPQGNMHNCNTPPPLPLHALSSL